VANVLAVPLSRGRSIRLRADPSLSGAGLASCGLCTVGFEALVSSGVEIVQHGLEAPIPHWPVGAGCDVSSGVSVAAERVVGQTSAPDLGDSASTGGRSGQGFRDSGATAARLLNRSDERRRHTPLGRPDLIKSVTKGGPVPNGWRIQAIPGSFSGSFVPT
jgi:hypothetical protein